MSAIVPVLTKKAEPTQCETDGCEQVGPSMPGGGRLIDPQTVHCLNTPQQRGEQKSAAGEELHRFSSRWILGALVPTPAAKGTRSERLVRLRTRQVALAHGAVRTFVSNTDITAMTEDYGSSEAVESC